VHRGSPGSAAGSVWLLQQDSSEGAPANSCFNVVSCQSVHAGEQPVEGVSIQLPDSMHSAAFFCMYQMYVQGPVFLSSCALL